MCSKKLQLPRDNRFDDLPTAFHINRLVDILALESPGGQCDNCDENVRATYCFKCRTFLCLHCLDVHNRLKVNRDHRLVPLDNLSAEDLEGLQKAPAVCEHWKPDGSKEPQEFYCQDCRARICEKCCRQSEHKKHTINEIKHVTAQYKMEILQAVEKMKVGLSERKKELEREERYLNNTDEEIQSSREKVQATVRELTQVLTEHEESTVKALGELYERQRQAHLAHKETYELLSTQIDSCTVYAEAVLTRNDDAEILEAQTAVVQQCTELMNQKVKASDRLSVYFEPNKELCSAVRDLPLGRTFERHNTDPLKSVAEGKGLNIAYPLLSNHFKVMTKDAEGKLSYCQDDCVTVSFQTDSGKELLLGTYITDDKEGAYFVSYRLLLRNLDTFNVLIKVNGRPLAGNPWKVVVFKNPYQVCSIS